MDSFNKLITILDKDNLFLTGGAGVGKSFMTKQISKYYMAQKKSVILLGSTGISAVNIGGQTLHSFFLFGISSNFEELKKRDRYNRSKIKELNKILKSLDLLIIDEISMVSSNLFDMVLYRLRESGFRGKLMVVGDFYQLSPVIKDKTNSLINSLYAFESSSWDYFDFVTVELTKIKRTDDLHFMKILGSIRKGLIDTQILDFLDSLRTNNLPDTNRTTLFGTNVQADRLNDAKLNETQGKNEIKKAIITKKDNSLDDRVIKGWASKLPILEELKLKEGVPIIFTTNRWGFYHNGEKGVVEHIDDDVILVQKGERLVKVERFTFELTRNVVDSKGEIGEEIICTLEQFPIRLGYAITIHKSQGMSIEDLVCNVDNIFTESQFYVALSRAVDPKRLKIEYTKDSFKEYLKRVIKINPKVDQFYSAIKKKIFLE
ncbi:MAG: PIF1 helicase [Sulfurospirillum sp.]|nr:MAG: PIF1 helicase [Sulfurospirillum sp.]